MIPCSIRSTSVRSWHNPDAPSAYRFLTRPDYSEPQALGNRLAAEVLAALKAGERRVVRSYPIRNNRPHRGRCAQR